MYYVLKFVSVREGWREEGPLTVSDEKKIRENSKGVVYWERILIAQFNKDLLRGFSFFFLHKLSSQGIKFKANLNLTCAWYKLDHL